MGNAQKQSELKQVLKNVEIIRDDPKKATEIVHSLGLFSKKAAPPNHSKKRKSVLKSNTKNTDDSKNEDNNEFSVLNMNNNVMMQNMSDKERENMR